jgi:hypothetical protein
MSKSCRYLYRNLHRPATPMSLQIRPSTHFQSPRGLLQLIRDQTTKPPHGRRRRGHDVLNQLVAARFCNTVYWSDEKDFGCKSIGAGDGTAEGLLLSGCRDLS